MNCPFCGKPAQWVPNERIYGKRYGKSYMAWWCPPCDAYVGCHENSKRPKGTMANAETRLWRQRAHDAFDPLWKSGRMTRDAAYRLLTQRLGRAEQVHIGESDAETCKAIIEMLTKEEAT